MYTACVRNPHASMSESLVLESWAVLNRLGSVRNWIQVLHKSGKCSWPPSHLSSPFYQIRYGNSKACVQNLTAIQCRVVLFAFKKSSGHLKAETLSNWKLCVACFGDFCLSLWLVLHPTVWEKGFSSCSPSWPQTHCIDQARPKLRDLHLRAAVTGVSCYSPGQVSLPVVCGAMHIPSRQKGLLICSEDWKNCHSDLSFQDGRFGKLPQQVKVRATKPDSPGSNLSSHVVKRRAAFF